MIRTAIKEIISVPTPNAHASCIARVNGETWLTWFGGTKEGDNDVDIYVTRRLNTSWSDPIRVTADENLPHWNPVLMPRGDGADLFFKLGATITGWQTMRVHLNSDMQPTGPIAELVPGDIGGRGPVRNKCLTLKDGRVLAPASIEANEPTAWSSHSHAAQLTSEKTGDAAKWKPFVDISRDGGETFTCIAPVPLSAADAEDPLPPAIEGGVSRRSAQPLLPCRIRGLGAIQPALWQSDDGQVHMLMRSSEGCILRSDSEDGETWSPACCTDLPNNNSGIDLVRMEDGRILLCLNPVSSKWGARTPLWLYVSTDNGESFQPLLSLETSEGEYSYPSLACEGNTVYLSYTWKRLSVAVWTIELEPRA